MIGGVALVERGDELPSYVHTLVRNGVDDW